MDQETKALTESMAMIASLDEAGQKRVMRYLSERFLGEQTTPVEISSSAAVAVPSGGAEKEEKPQGKKRGRKPGSTNRKTSTSSSTTSSGTSKRGRKPKADSDKKSSYSNLPDFNVNAGGDKPTLREFYTEKNPRRFPERHTVLLYYLSHIKQVEEVNLSHIYTAYKSLKVKPPKNLYQSFLQMGSLHKYFDTKNMNDIKLTPKGNKLVQDLPEA